jgi:hypothetical protein
LGIDDLRWSTIYTSNLQASGQVRATSFVGDGSMLTGVPVPYSFEGLEQNLIPAEDFKRDIGAHGKRFKSVYCSNIIAEGNIIAPRFVGSGNALMLDSVISSVIPANQSLTLGTEAKRFDSLHTRVIDATGEVKAMRFVGDGSMLTGIKSSNVAVFTKIDSSFFVQSNMAYNIGTPEKRFANVYTGNLSALGIISGSRLLITNEGISINIASTSSNNMLTSAGVKFNPDLPEDIRGKFGDQIDAALNNLLVGVVYAQEFIGDGALIHNIYSLAPMRSNIIPYERAKIDIGNESVPFKDFHTINGYFQNDVVVGRDLEVGGNLLVSKNVAILENVLVEKGFDVMGDMLVLGQITCSNFVGDGRFLDNITHFGLINSNVYPFQPNVIEIGAMDMTFKSLHADHVNAPLLLTTGQAGIGTMTPNYDLDVNGDIHFQGRMYNKGSPTSTTKSGIIVPKQMTWLGAKKVLFQRQTIEHFTTVDMTTSKFTVYENGLYNIAGYTLKTSRNRNDMFVSWRIQHHVYHNNTSVEYRVRGCESKTFFMQQYDSIEIMMDSGIDPGASTGVPLTLYQSGAFVVTQLNVMPDVDIE